MLGPLGLTPATEALYLRLVESDSIPLPVAGGAADVTALLSAGLAVELPEGYGGHLLNARSRLVAVLPDEGIGRLLLAEEQRITEERDRLLKMRREFAAVRELFEASRGASENADLVQVLAGRDEVGAAFETVLNVARHEYSTMETSYFVAEPEAGQIDTVAPEHEHYANIRHRTIYDHTIYTQFPEFGQLMLRESRAAGEIQRMVPRLPLKMVMADETLALVALTMTGVDGAMLVRSKRLLSLLRDFFESLWQRASPIDGGVDQQLVDHRYGQVPTLLSAGLGDDAVARQLGMGLRTVRRRIAEMSDDLGAHSRFQAGVLAEKRGYVRDES